MKRTSISKTPGSGAAPKLTQANFDRASFRVAGKKATRAQWQAAVAARIGTQRMNITLDAPSTPTFARPPASG